MKYRFYGDTLQLVRYELSAEVTRDVHDEEEPRQETYTHKFSAATETEKDGILQHYPDAAVTEIDNSGYEWLDGLTFTQEQLRNGEIEQAIAMGREAYEAMRNAPAQDEINAMLLLQLAKLKTEVTGGE